jgi:hypothetical protein
LKFFSHRGHKIDYVRGLSLGLAASNHVTAVLIFPMALVLGAVHNQPTSPNDSRAAYSWFRNLKLDLPPLYRQCLGLVLGLLPYMILPLRALTQPVVNWGNPITLQNFWWSVSGQLYQSYYFQSSLADVWGHIQNAAVLLFEQFGFIGVLIGVLGLVVFGLKSRLYALTLWISASNAAFACYYRAEDSYLYLIPAFACFAIWMGLGVSGSLHRFTGQAFSRRLLLQLLLLAYLMLRSETAFGKVDASHDRRAESFGREVLRTAPQNAILFAKGDRAIFALWYFHFGLGERPDLAILAVDLLHFDWYQESIRATYPLLKINAPLPWAETIANANPSRAVCSVQYTYKTMMECSEPLLLP